MNLDAMLRIKADVQGENNIRRLGNSMQGVQGKVKNLQMSFGGLSNAVKGFAAVLSIGAFTAFVKSGIDAADAMGKASARTGVAAEQLISFQNAAALADVSNEQLIKGLTKLNINMVSAAEGNDELNKRFQQLGITVKKEDGTLKETSQVFKEISDRFKDMPNGAQKAAAAMSIFGKSGVELITLLNGGSASLDEFTYKLSDEFAARSEYFNDSITKLGFKTQGFQMQLMDALLPALQSILDVFADLFATDNDWTALFEVIKGGLRIVAAAIYATVALTGQLARVVVGTFQTVSKALQGDFGGAMDLFRNNVAGAIDQAKRDFANLGKIFTDAPAPGGGVGRRGFEMRDLGAEREADAAARKAASEADRAAKKALDDYNKSLEQASDLADDLTRKTRDLGLKTERFGVDARKAIELDFTDAMNRAGDEADDLAQKVADLIKLSGGQLRFEGLQNKVREYLTAIQVEAETARSDALIELYKNEAQAIDEATASSWEFAAAQQYNNDILGGLKDGLQGYIDQLGTMRDAVNNLAQGAFKGLEDALVSLVTTGSANFREFARSVLEATSRMIIQQLILKTIMSAIGGFGGGGGGLGGVSTKGVPSYALPSGGGFASGFNLSAMGNVFAQNGIQKFARGGIIDKPTVFPFANGIGLMGEAGPEAIMPLKRGSDGRLGVAGGGGVKVGEINITVQNTGENLGPEAQKRIANQVQGIVMATLVNERRSGGVLR